MDKLHIEKLGISDPRTAKCRTPDQWVDVHYVYDVLEQQAVYQNQVLEEMNLLEKGVVYAGAFSQGVWDDVTEFADFIRQLTACPDPVGRTTRCG